MNATTVKRILNSQLTMVRSIIDFIQSPPVLFCQQFFLLNARTRTILSQFQESANSQLFKTISVSHITVIVASGISLGVILIVISVAFLIGLPFKRNLFFSVSISSLFILSPFSRWFGVVISFHPNIDIYFHKWYNNSK